MHSDDSVLKKIVQLRFPLLELVLQQVPFLDLGFERLRLLLEMHNFPELLVLGCEAGEGFRGHDVGVFLADLGKLNAVGFIHKRVEGIRAVQLEAVVLSKLIP